MSRIFCVVVGKGGREVYDPGRRVGAVIPPSIIFSDCLSNCYGEEDDPIFQVLLAKYCCKGSHTSIYFTMGRTCKKVKRTHWHHIQAAAAGVLQDEAEAETAAA